ncbi:hypothetical protein [Telluria aromaticivorans]|uniref:Lipoprotein SmpA/OmlA domain-containing protein n=1 Tax=Telluria aromaticivorans TaxID=2725995 RepID=A0A7Y2P2B9_9BURK|nr:hypothetical protein [Telluria aromaticivorans]NNG24779.1 hypothetical protein [Telluria aromaticivorans]
MKLPTSVLGAILLAACASSPVPPGTQASSERLQQTIVPGTTTKAQLLAALGPTKSVVFDSGYETWVYQAPAGGGRFAEYVVLINPSGVVTKTRTRAPALP